MAATAAALTASEESQLTQTIEMFEVITQSQPQDYQSLEILKEAYVKLGRDTEIVGVSKRIAQAYVLMGQLSSAILEYESILQQHPDDPEVKGALAEIESKANSLTSQPALGEGDTLMLLAGSVPGNTVFKAKSKSKSGQISAVGLDDGRDAMRKIFVEGKLISAADFDLYWVPVDAEKAPEAVVEPFIQLLADKSVLPLERSLKAVVDKARVGYLPLDKYDIDIELARSFPAETCKRWCVLPFDRMSKSILVATTNPFNRQAAAELEQATKQRLLWYLAPPPDLVKALQKVFR